jgi:uncharacterized protein YceH (UPF0502 family)
LRADAEWRELLRRFDRWFETPWLSVSVAALSLAYWALLDFGVVAMGRGVYEYDKRFMVLVAAVWSAIAIVKLSSQVRTLRIGAQMLEARIAELERSIVDVRRGPDHSTLQAEIKS